MRTTGQQIWPVQNKRSILVKYLCTILFPGNDLSSSTRVCQEVRVGSETKLNLITQNFVAAQFFWRQNLLLHNFFGAKMGPEEDDGEKSLIVLA